MTFRENLRRARSHLIIVVIMLVAGYFVVRIEDRNLEQEIGKPAPQHLPEMPARPAGTGK